MGLVRSQSADKSSWCQAEECLFPSLCWIWGSCRDVAFSKGEMGRIGWELMCWPLSRWPFWAIKKSDQFRTILKGHHMGLAVTFPQWPLSPQLRPSSLCHLWQQSNKWTLQSLMNSWQLLYIAPISWFLSTTDYPWTQHFLHSQDGRAQSQRGNSIFHPLFPPSSLPTSCGSKRWLLLSTAGWCWHCQYWI